MMSMTCMKKGEFEDKKKIKIINKQFTVGL